MDTKVLIVDKNVDSLDSYPQVKKAAQLLRAGEVVAFPTETVYGLGGDARSDEAIAKIFQAKGRPSDNPLIVHIAHYEQLEKIVTEITATAKHLIDNFWPGPLTLIFHKKNKELSEKVTAGLSTVAVRMPDHPVALSIIKSANIPIAAPSANRSGKPSPTTANHVKDDLSGKIAAIIDGGATGVGLESTVVDCTVNPPVILRPGSISAEQLAAVIGQVNFDQALTAEGGQPRSPGMKYRHYAPTAPLYLVDGTAQFLQALIGEQRQLGKKVGLLTTEEAAANYNADKILACGSRTNLRTVAANLFASLRAFDEEKVDIIYSEVFPEDGVGKAIMNRLLKAANNKIITEND